MQSKAKPISADLAYKIRYHRGLKLPEYREYEDPRVKQIAIEQSKLFTQLRKLDDELYRIHFEEIGKRLRKSL